jgi:hypothetical protein
VKWKIGCAQNASYHRLAVTTFSLYSLYIKWHCLERCLQVQSPLHPFAQALCIKGSPHLHVVVKVDIDIARWNLPAPFPASEPATWRLISSGPSGDTIGPEIKCCIVIAAGVELF